MNQDKVKIQLSGVSETLLLPLWARAQCSSGHHLPLNDTKAIELVENIDYDFSKIDKAFGFESLLINTARTKQFDNKIKAYIAEHSHASVINLGAGLDTTFYRVDNGLIHWYDLDLPMVIDIRRQLLPEPDRVTYISKSLFDPSWCEDIEHTEGGVFMIAGGLFYYFEESQVKQFFSLLADNLPSSEIAFDVVSKLSAFFSIWSVRRMGIHGVRAKWSIKNADKMTKWDKRITVIDQFPMFKNIARDPVWGSQIKRRMDWMDKSGMFKIFHVRV